MRNAIMVLVALLVIAGGPGRAYGDQLEFNVTATVNMYVGTVSIFGITTTDTPIQTTIRVDTGVAPETKVPAGSPISLGGTDYFFDRDLTFYPVASITSLALTIGYASWSEHDVLEQSLGSTTFGLLSQANPDGSASVFILVDNSFGQVSFGSLNCTPSCSAGSDGYAQSYLEGTFAPVSGIAASVTTIASDSTPPSIAPTITGIAGNNGWEISNVGLTWSVTDQESAISSTAGCDPVTITSDTAGLTLTCTATSGGGSSSASVTVKRDATPPTAAATAGPPANQDGWRKSNVTITYSGTDAMSGIASCDPQTVITTEGTGLSAGGRCADNAGNVSALASVIGINIDKTNPTVTISSPADGATFTRNQAVPASYGCSDALSGVASCAGNVPVGTNIDTSKSVKNAKFTVDATDRAGNKTKKTVTYSVR